MADTAHSAGVKHLIVFAMILTSGLGIASGALAAGQQAAKNTQVPMTTKLKLVSGKGQATLGQTISKNDVTVVQFWASWCVGCAELMADLAKRSRTDQSVGFASVSIDEDLETAQRYFKAKPQAVRDAIPHALLDEAGERIASKLKIKSLPYVVVVTKDGRVFEGKAGHPTPEELSSMISRARQKSKTVVQAN